MPLQILAHIVVYGGNAASYGFHHNSMAFKLNNKHKSWQNNSVKCLFIAFKITI